MAQCMAMATALGGFLANAEPAGMAAAPAMATPTAATTRCFFMCPLFPSSNAKCARRILVRTALGYKGSLPRIGLQRDPRGRYDRFAQNAQSEVAHVCQHRSMSGEGMKPRSHEVTDGYVRAGARAMLRAVGRTDDDWDKPQIGVASSWHEVTPCNMSLDRLAKRAKDGVRQAGGFPLEFVTIAVSDGISMGHEGMRASLVSREIIADSVEVMMHAERLDGMVTFAGCDKSLPGMLMAAARLNLPSVFLYGGTILPGRLKDQALDIVSVFEAIGAHAAGGLTEEELSLIERNACPTVGSCAGMFTANTMASVAEALGMSLAGSSAAPAVDRRRDDFAYASGKAVMRLIEAGIRPRQIMTKEAFENAIAVVNALGGSTNAVLHLLAIANEARVELELEDFNRVGKRVPHIADMK